MSNFSQFNLSNAVIKNLEKQGFTTPTPIQSAALPIVLEGEDIIAKAPTGSGKTIAFGLALIERLQKEPTLRALVICPTRELAEQVSETLRMLAKAVPNTKIISIIGGVPLRTQVSSLKHGAHIAVGTPGRIKDHLSRGTLPLDNIVQLVLDEADKMLDMGFLDVVLDIVRQTPKVRQSMLFSATINEKVTKLATTLLNAPKEIRVEAEKEALIEHFAVTFRGNKAFKLLQILSHFTPETTIIFCNTKAEVHELMHLLRNEGYDALPLHGDMEQNERSEALLQLHNHSTRIIVATDLASRGLDIKGLSLVINYDVPQKSETFIHRSGRTGRANTTGHVVSMASNLDQLARFESSFTSLELDNETMPLLASHDTLIILAGKKDKIRPGDIVGALTKEHLIPSDALGEIEITPKVSYLAVQKAYTKKALKQINAHPVKKRRVRAYLLSSND